MKNESENAIQKLRILLPHWIEHNGEHAAVFRERAAQAGPAREELLAAASLLEEANERLERALEQLGGSLPHTSLHVSEPS